MKDGRCRLIWRRTDMGPALEDDDQGQAASDLAASRRYGAEGILIRRRLERSGGAIKVTVVVWLPPVNGSTRR